MNQRFLYAFTMLQPSVNPCFRSFSKIRRAEYGASSIHPSTICLYGSIFVGLGSLSVYSGFYNDCAYRFAVRGFMWYFFSIST